MQVLPNERLKLVQRVTHDDSVPTRLHRAQERGLRIRDVVRPVLQFDVQMSIRTGWYRDDDVAHTARHALAFQLCSVALRAWGLVRHSVDVMQALVRMTVAPCNTMHVQIRLRQGKTH